MATPAVRAIVTDIEGTTSSIDFVHDCLFPYARKHLRAFLGQHAGRPDVAEQLAAVAAEVGRELDVDQAEAILDGWMAEDRKATPLKALQGMIWRHGYEGGELHGHVYADTPDYLRRWHDAGLRLYVYSSGSVEAQQLIFGHSDAGDLRPLFSGWFDTRVGGKREAASYRAILAGIGLPAGAVLFLSDVGAELDAAAAAGLRTCQLLRDEQAVPAPGHLQVADFSEVPVPV